MSFSRSALRLASIAAVIAAMAAVTVGSAGAQDGSPAPSAGPASPSASAAASPDADTSPPTPVILPIPVSIWPIPVDLPTISLEPESAPSLTVGQPVPYALGHCGLYSPIDVDGSLWEPVGGTAADGGPIVSDEAIGELINATDGELLLVSDDAATFITAGGSTIHLARALGALDYPPCM